MLGLLLLGLITLNTVLSKPNGAHGIEPGQPMAPFAVPLAKGTLNGEADIATRPNQGLAGKVPACSERGPAILNICELYEQGPVVLALFVDRGSCAGILQQMQNLSSQFPSVRFAAVAIKEGRGELPSVIRAHGLSIPIGFDNDGVLADLYKLASCPQVNFAYRGGEVQSPALLGTPTIGTLRARVSQLLTAARARAHHQPA
jgi:hypothetical protein